MKRLLATTLLSLVCCAAHAEWIHSATVEGDSYKTYVDPTTYRRDGQFVKAWVIIDLVKPEIFSGNWYISSKNQVQYDCKEEAERVLFASFYLKSMAQGTPHKTNNQPDAPWIPVIPDSVRAWNMKLACAYKP